jgi:hypothetical protein
MLLITTSLYIFFTPKDLKKESQFLSRLLLCVQVPHALLTLKPQQNVALLTQHESSFPTDT